MDNEFIERCVKAVAQSNEQNGALPFDAWNKYAIAYTRDEVKAVISELRKPTEKMKDIRCSSIYYSSEEILNKFVDLILNEDK